MLFHGMGNGPCAGPDQTKLPRSLTHRKRLYWKAAGSREDKVPNFIYTVATVEFEIEIHMGVIHTHQRVEFWRAFRISKRVSSSTAHLIMTMSQSLRRPCSVWLGLD